ncbi:hypothetical protein AVEN_181713-1 [Araneus ventricosus]|uniref:Uncharacterized protein n=1 Tax=Araneus ventricosus TaxID=182803 RepID=A0A4Y2EA14_ARAVE|nr:hypothetical protein AVEN_181713-1 [Araneus ventricosus]
MECRFPAMLVLWLGRDFYKGKYGMTGSGQSWTPDLGEGLGDKSKIPENAIIFSISLLGAEIRFLQRFPCDATSSQKHYKYTAAGIDGERLWSANVFEESLGVSSAVRAERYWKCCYCHF